MEVDCTEYLSIGSITHLSPPKEVHDEFGLFPVFAYYPAALAHVGEGPIDMRPFLGTGTSQLVVRNFRPDLSFHPCMVSRVLKNCCKRNSLYLVKDKPCLIDLAVLSFYPTTLPDGLLWAVLSYPRPPVTAHFASTDAIKHFAQICSNSYRTLNIR